MKHKYTIVLILLFSFYHSNAADTVSMVGLKYHEARETLMNYGWSPMEIYSQGDTTLHIKDVCPEVLDCSIGKAQCAFGFLNSDNECMYIFTIGNEIKDLLVHMTYGGCDSFHANGIKRCGTTENVMTLAENEIKLLIDFFINKSLNADTSFPDLNISAESVCSFSVLSGPRCGGLNETYHESLFGSQFYVLSEGKNYWYSFIFTIAPTIDRNKWSAFKHMKEIFDGRAVYQHDIIRQDNSKNTNPIERISRNSDQGLCK